MKCKAGLILQDSLDALFGGAYPGCSRMAPLGQLAKARELLDLIEEPLAATGHMNARVREALKVKGELEALGLDQDAQVTALLGQIATRSGDLERALLTLTTVISGSRQKRTTGS